MAFDPKAYHRAYYQAHKERIKARVKAYAETHREQRREYVKAYCEANKGILQAQKKADYAAHREERISKQKRYAKANRDNVRAYKKQWWEEGKDSHHQKQRERYQKRREEISTQYRHKYTSDPQSFKARTRAYALANPEKVREFAARRRAREASTQAERVNFKAVLKLADGLCGICHKPFDLFGIEFDHIVPLSKGGTHTQENIQATHARCNRAKAAKVG